MNRLRIAPRLRLAQPDEHAELCARMAAMDPWLRLELRGETLLRALQNDPLRQTWVSEEDGRITGCVMFRPIRCCQLLCDRDMAGPLALKHGLPPDTPADTLPDGGYVNALAVFPGNQARGTGWALLSRAEEITAEESRRIYLCVSEANPRAREFYERHGYELIGNLHDCLRPGNTEHLMVKELGAV